MRTENGHFMKKTFSGLILTMFYTQLFLIMVGLCGCSGGSGASGSGNPPASKTLTSIAIQPVDNKLAAGKTKQFTAIGTYTDGTTNTNLSSSVSWSSSSTSVATITPDGMATAVADGQTTITATLEGVSDSTTLTVPAVTLVLITVTPSNPTIAINTTQQFTATGVYSDDSFQVLTSAVTWSSSENTIASIAQNGKATAAAPGSATITATLGTVSAKTTLNVTPALLTSIAVTPSNPFIAAGTTQQFVATGTFSDNTTQDLTTQVSWSSSAGSIAGIAQDGKATAAAPGSATITAASGTVSAIATLNVTPALLTSIAVTPSNPRIAAGTTQQFTATGTFSDNTTQDLSTQVSWSSSASSIASIAQNGMATAVAAGTTSITAVSGGVSGSRDLTVIPADATGTWEGTYYLFDSIDPSQIGTYTLKLVLNQSGTSVTGTSSLRYNTIGQISADGQFIEGNVTGNKIAFIFTYTKNSAEMVDIGTATITDTSMTGVVLENFSGGYNCSYRFSLKKM